MTKPISRRQENGLKMVFGTTYTVTFNKQGNWPKPRWWQFGYKRFLKEMENENG